MAELSKYPTQERIFFEIFVPGYNAMHGTAYTGQPDIEEHRLWDYSWPAPDSTGVPLEVQHTAAGGDSKRERVSPKNLGEVRSELQLRLKQLGVPGYIISLRWVDGVPENSKVRRGLAEEVWSRIEETLTTGFPVGESRTVHRHSRRDPNDSLLRVPETLTTCFPETLTT